MTVRGGAGTDDRRGAGRHARDRRCPRRSARRVLALAADALGEARPRAPAAAAQAGRLVRARPAGRLAGSQIAGVLESDEEFRERLADPGARDRRRARPTALPDGAAPGRGRPGRGRRDGVPPAARGWEELRRRGGATRARRERDAADEQQGEEQLAPAAPAARGRPRPSSRRSAGAQGAARPAEAGERRPAPQARRGPGRGCGRPRTQAGPRAAEGASEARGRAAGARRRRGRGTPAARPGERARGRPRLRPADRAGRRRVEETVRARLLLDTLVEAAHGLRRELGLPAVERLPADTVDRRRGRAGHAGPRRVAGSLPVDDPALLEELLRLPRAHLVVDGYNVTKTRLAGPAPGPAARPAARPARRRCWPARGAEVTVVFDAARDAGPPAGDPAARRAGAVQPLRRDRRRRDPRPGRRRAARAVRSSWCPATRRWRATSSTAGFRVVVRRRPERAARPALTLPARGRHVRERLSEASCTLVATRVRQRP